MKRYSERYSEAVNKAVRDVMNSDIDLRLKVDKW